MHCVCSAFSVASVPWYSCAVQSMCFSVMETSMSALICRHASPLARVCQVTSCAPCILSSMQTFGVWMLGSMKCHTHCQDSSNVQVVERIYCLHRPRSSRLTSLLCLYAFDACSTAHGRCQVHIASAVLAGWLALQHRWLSSIHNCWQSFLTAMTPMVMQHVQCPWSCTSQLPEI